MCICGIHCRGWFMKYIDIIINSQNRITAKQHVFSDKLMAEKYANLILRQQTRSPNNACLKLKA